jgi:uncharacterized protein (DUF1778 family)
MARTSAEKKTTATPARKDDVIQIRAPRSVKALLNQAAALRGQKLSEFILESARRSAEDAILDQRVFILSPEDHERFIAQLDSPREPSEAVRARYKRKRAWER